MVSCKSYVSPCQQQRREKMEREAINLDDNRRDAKQNENWAQFEEDLIGTLLANISTKRVWVKDGVHQHERQHVQSRVHGAIRVSEIET